MEINSQEDLQTVVNTYIYIYILKIYVYVYLCVFIQTILVLCLTYIAAEQMYALNKLSFATFQESMCDGMNLNLCIHH